MRYITEWREVKDNTITSYYVVTDPSRKTPHIAAKVFLGSIHSRWCYVICEYNGSIEASNTNLPTFGEAKAGCEMELTELGFEFISDERAEKLSVLL